MFGTPPNNQIPRVIETLKARPDSRQAVVQLFDRTDTIEPHLDIPCTCTLQFFIRSNRLHMLTSMRSNDAWKGLPHDVFTFTMLQELVARSLDVELGEYKHSVGSLHLYESDQEKAIRFIDEGWQPRRSMQPMPHGDPWSAVNILLDHEKQVRAGDANALDPRDFMQPYWANLATLLSIYKAEKNQTEIKRLRARLNDDVYSMYINKRYRRASPVKEQLSIFDRTGKKE